MSDVVDPGGRALHKTHMVEVIADPVFAITRSTIT